MRCKELRDAEKLLKTLVPSVPDMYVLPAVGKSLAAAKRGDATAQFFVATAYLSGTNVVQSDASAVAWYQRCCEQKAARPVLPARPRRGRR